MENELGPELTDQHKSHGDHGSGVLTKISRPVEYLPGSNRLLYSQGRTLFFCSLDSMKEETVQFDSRIVGIAHKNSQEIFVATEKGLYARNPSKDNHEFTILAVTGLDQILAGDRSLTFLKYHKKLNLLYLGVQDLLLSITPETGTPNHLLDHEGIGISNFEWISSQEMLTALNNGYIYRWHVDGEFRGAIQSSSSEVTQMQQFHAGGAQKGLVCCGSTLAVDMYLDFCHVATFLLR